MKFDEMRIGQTVKDRWFDRWGFGKVVKKLKTVVYINFNFEGLVKFDRAHVQFLNLIKEK